MACVPATFRAWKPREIQRLHNRVASDSHQAAAAIREIVGVDLTVREHAIAIGVDTNFRIVAVSDGTSPERSSCAYHVRELIGTLYVECDPARIAAIFLGHNHPSGDAQPSPEDVKMTEKLVRVVGGFLPVMDHVIVSTGSDMSGAVISMFKKTFSMLEEYGERMFKAPDCK